MMRFFERRNAAYLAFVEKGQVITFPRAECAAHHPYEKRNRIAFIEGRRSMSSISPS